MPTLAEHADALQGFLGDLTALTTRDLVELWRQVSGQDVITAADQQLLDMIKATAPEIISPYIEAAAEVTAQWYDELAPEVAFRATPATNIVKENRMLRTIEWAMRAQGVASLGRLTGSAKRMVMDGSRQTVMVNARAEKVKFLRYAAAGACAWCSVLATRGAVYHTAENAVKGHDNCHCLAVPERRGQRFTPPDYYDEFEAEYQAARTALEDEGKIPTLTNVVDHIEKKRATTPQPLPMPTPPAPKKKPAPAPTPAPPTPAPAPKKKAPRKKKDPLPSLRKKTDADFDLQTDLQAVNPNYTKGQEWQVNCTRCATAVELRHRGYDVTAESRQSTQFDNSLTSILVKWRMKNNRTAGVGISQPLKAGETLGMGDFKGHRPWHEAPTKGPGAKADIDAAALQWGDGGRGFVVVQWAGLRGAHIFNVVNDGGKVRYIDGQPNDPSVAGYFHRVDAKAPVHVVRTDDMRPTAEVTKWVRSRSDTEVTRTANLKKMLARTQNPTP